MAAKEMTEDMMTNMTMFVAKFVDTINLDYFV